jgi:hypothetical protein
MADLCDALKSQVCSNTLALNQNLVFNLDTTFSNVKYCSSKSEMVLWRVSIAVDATSCDDE